MLRVLHIDKIDDDDTAQIPQTQLAGDDLGCFKIGFKNGVVKTAYPDESSRIDIDGGQRLGLIDNEISAGFQVNPSGQGFFNFIFHSVKIE